MIKNNVQAMRWKKNMSLRQLSNRSGIPRTTINSIENNLVLNPTIETAFRLSRALGVSIEELFEYGKCFV